jgi:polyisoprenoid-binding protein YceI
MKFQHILAASAVMLALSAPAFAADVYHLEPTHTSVTMQYTHLGFSHPTIKLMSNSGTITIDEADLSKSALDVSIDMTAINSGVAEFDKHLNSPGFFDTAVFPKATFKSTKVVVTGATTADVTGNLTVKNVTRPVVLKVTLNKKGVHPISKKQAIGFSATTTISRSEFGLNAYVPFVSDEVTIAIETEADK